MIEMTDRAYRIADKDQQQFIPLATKAARKIIQRKQILDQAIRELGLQALLASVKLYETVPLGSLNLEVVMLGSADSDVYFRLPGVVYAIYRVGRKESSSDAEAEV